MKAFPCEWGHYDREAEKSIEIGERTFTSKGQWVKHTDPGMDLRDYFAAKAMQAYWADGEVPHDLKTAAAWSYDMADAMMEARKK